MMEIPGEEDADDYVTDEEVVYGSYMEYLIIIPKNQALEWAQLRRGLKCARTFGEFKSMVTLERYEEVVRLYAFDDLEPEQENNGYEPDDSFPFDTRYIWGYHDGDWPEWWQQEWQKWLPGKVQQYGMMQLSRLNGWFLYLPLVREADIIAMLEHYGYTCTRDEKLAGQAIGNVESCE
jgi:hypothetical protein